MGHFKFVGIFFLVIIAIALSGCFNEDNPASCSYEVTISGLADYSSSDTTFILIPAPVMSGEPIFSDKDLQDLRLNGWNASIVNTEYGDMISFQTNDKNLTDINIHYPNNTLSKAISGQYDTLENKSIVAKEILSGFPLCPMVQKIDTNDRFARNISVSNYTSYVFLNNDIMSKNGNNSITFTLRLLISEGRSSSQFGKTYTIEVLKNVQDERGWIPVEVRYASVYPRET